MYKIHVYLLLQLHAFMEMCDILWQAVTTNALMENYMYHNSLKVHNYI